MTEKKYVLTESELIYLIDNFNDRTGSVIIDDYQQLSGQTSDGYHTFDELYEHRVLLFINLIDSENAWLEEFGCRNDDRLPWWSEYHDDGTRFDNYIIAGFKNKNEQMITYHMHEKYIPLLKRIRKLERAPKWDGHTSEDVIKRLTEHAE